MLVNVVTAVANAWAPGDPARIEIAFHKGSADWHVIDEIGDVYRFVGALFGVVQQRRPRPSVLIVGGLRCNIAAFIYG